MTADQALDTFTLLKAAYKHSVPAEALFSNAGGKAFRLEVSEIGREFTDGVYIGKDPEGTLFYNNYDSLDDGRTVNYQSTRHVNPSDGKVCARIKFYSVSVDHCHAEFLAYDPDETIKVCEMDGYSHSGQWVNLISGSATAVIRKYDDEDQLTISAAPIRMKATITGIANSSKILSDKSVGVHGNLHFKDISAISKARFANYNNNRIIFYESSHFSTDFTAYFIPYESSDTRLGVEVADTVELSEVTWSTL